MERETRFELATSTLARLHSTTELLPLNQFFYPPLRAGLLIANGIFQVNIKFQFLFSFFTQRFITLKNLAR